MGLDIKGMRPAPHRPLLECSTAVSNWMRAAKIACFSCHNKLQVLAQFLTKIECPSQSEMEKAENRRVAMSIGFALTEAAQQGANSEREREVKRETARGRKEGSESVANGRAASGCFDWLRHKFAINCSVVYTMKTLRIRHLVPGPGMLVRATSTQNVLETETAQGKHLSSRMRLR